MEVYERETKDVIRRFLGHKLTFPACIVALDAALAGLIPHAANAAIRITRPHAGEQQQSYGRNGTPSCLTNRMSFKHCYIDCKACGRRITLEVQNHDHADAIQKRRAEKLRCPTCLIVSSYLGDEFKTATLTA